MDVGKLTDKQVEKLEACKTSEEVLEFAKAEGFELSDEDLEAVAGGASWGSDDSGESTIDGKPIPRKCAKCGGNSITGYANGYGPITWHCNSCGEEWG